MDKKQQEQLRKGLVFGGLGLLCSLSLWFIFAPSDKDKDAEQEGLNKDIPEAIVHQLTDIPVKLSAYDLDGQEGIYIPGAEQVSALKEVGANIGGSVGTSFTFASSAKDQIISEADRGVMQGASQLLQKKLRTLQVTLKGGYRLFLVPSK